MKTYVLMCEYFSVYKYITEVVCVYENEDSANKQAQTLQEPLCTTDAYYYVKEVDFYRGME